MQGKLLLAHTLLCLISSLQGAPTFAVVPQAQLVEGQSAVAQLATYAKKEGFLDRLLGTACFSTAVESLNKNCKQLEQDIKYRLALSLLNCHQHIVHGRVYVCTASMQIQQCLAGMSDRDHSAYMEFLLNVDSMCLFIQNQNFQAHTEHMMNALYEGAREANAALAVINPVLERQHSQLQGMGERLQTLGHMQTQVFQEVQQTATDLHRVSDQARQLEAGMQASLANEAASMEKQEAFMQTLQLHSQQEAAHSEEASHQWKIAQQQAGNLVAQQQQHKQLQQDLLQGVSKLSKESATVQSAINIILDYERRSDAFLVRLLGKSYRLEDALTYGTAVLVAVAAGVLPATRQARLPLLALVAMSLAAERSMPAWLQGAGTIDPSGQVVLLAAKHWWLPLAAEPQLKLAVRSFFTLLAAALVTKTVLHHVRQQPLASRLEQHMHSMEAMLQAAEARHAQLVRQQQAEQLAALIAALQKSEQPTPAAAALEEGPGRLEQLLGAWTQAHEHHSQQHAFHGKERCRAGSDVPQAADQARNLPKQPCREVTQQRSAIMEPGEAIAHSVTGASDAHGKPGVSRPAAGPSTPDCKGTRQHARTAGPANAVPGTAPAAKKRCTQGDTDAGLSKLQQEQQQHLDNALCDHAAPAADPQQTRKRKVQMTAHRTADDRSRRRRT